MRRERGEEREYKGRVELEVQRMKMRMGMGGGGLFIQTSSMTL